LSDRRVLLESAAKVAIRSAKGEVNYGDLSQRERRQTAEVEPAQAR
jgi:hypothetical protein